MRACYVQAAAELLDKIDTIDLMLLAIKESPNKEPFDFDISMGRFDDNGGTSESNFLINEEMAQEFLPILRAQLIAEAKSYGVEFKELTP